MIEITYGHHIKRDILYQKKLSFGHGLPTHGQTDFVTLIKEEINRKTGTTIWATLVWRFSFPFKFQR